jgi:hypothetical protein
VAYVYQGFSVSTDALSARVLAPIEPRIARATDAVRQCRSPREAWEALIARGMIPLEWAEDERRVFALTGRGRATPLRVADAVRIAAAPEQALAAEGAARLCAERAAPWMREEREGAPVHERPILWRFVAPARRQRTRGTGGVGTISDLNVWVHYAEIAHDDALRALDAEPAAPRSGWRAAIDGVARGLLERIGLRSQRASRDSWEELCAQSAARSFGLLESAMWDVRLAWTWDALGAIGAVAREHNAMFPGPARWLGASFASLPNPYEPRVALWLTGYAPRLLLPTAIELVTVSASIGDGVQ